MRLVTYEVEHKGGLGVISRDGKWVYPLRSLDMDYKTMQELIEGISESEKQLLEYVSAWVSTIWLTQRSLPATRKRHLEANVPMPFTSPSV